MGSLRPKPAILLLSALAMAAFAANSLLARGALGAMGMDAAGFTAIRLISGAAVLAAIVRMRAGRNATSPRMPGSWVSALALFVYAFGFSLAYLRLGAATGAFILFASVQAGMVVAGLYRGERLRPLELAGYVLALLAFASLLAPGLSAPDMAGTVLMIVAGLAWAVYCLRGRGAKDAVAVTAGNFARACLFCLPLAGAMLVDGHATGGGIALALGSGVIASGLGYAIWYSALPGLGAIEASALQLTVPLLAAVGAVLFLSEPATSRLLVSGVLMLTGMGLAVWARRS